MKEQQLDFRRGISNNPGDLICDDNSLVRCENLYFDGIQHRPIQEPVGLDVSISGTLLFVHHVPDGSRNYISLSGTQLYSNNAVMFSSSAVYTASGEVVVQAIGNILIVNDANGLHYILWKSSSYKYLGQQIPIPDVKFKTGTKITKQNTVKANEVLEMVADRITAGREYVYMQIKEGKLDVYNDAVIGLYSKNVKALGKSKAFCTPFFASYALELYDGSYIYQGVPQLIFPCVRQNTYAKFHDDEWLTLYTDGMELACQANFDYTEWSDIVKDVVLFVTDGAYVYDTTGDQVEPDANGRMIPDRGYEWNNDNYIIKNYGDYVNANGAYIESPFPGRSMRYLETDPRDPGVAYFYPLKRIAASSDTDLINEIKSLGIFYRIGSLGIHRSDNNTFFSTAGIISPLTLENLVTQDEMDVDWYSRCRFAPSFIKCLNNRLHIAGITRSLPSIEEWQIPWTGGSATTTKNVSVTVSTPSGNLIVSSSFTSSQRFDAYFFYPDPRAKSVTINSTIYTLEEHGSLNGSFHLTKLPSSTPETNISQDQNVTDSTPFEVLQSQLYVSEVNNPFTFRPKNVVQIGTSKILDLASLTTALSQGQFGQYPLVVFTEQGIWALNVTTEGVYASSHPMSREVLIDGNHPLETDGAVFFTSKKGLMLINGNQVTCVSEQLSGKELIAEEADEEHSIAAKYGPCALTFQSCFMAYDYRDSLIYIFPKSGSVPSGYTAGNYALVFSIKGGTFGTKMFGSAITQAVADYPDYILQSGTTLLSFISRSDINRDTVTTTTEGNTSTTAARTYDGLMLSRPLKLENGLALKSIMQVRHIMDLHPAEEEEDDDEEETTEEADDQSEETEGGDDSNEGAGDEPTGGDGAANDTPRLVFGLEGSNNAKKWCPLHSLRGMPWKYYRFKYTFTGLKATDTFAGTVILTEERRANKLR